MGNVHQWWRRWYLSGKKVKIENGLEVTGISTFSGALTVGGVLTLDVTNVDSIGIITAEVMYLCRLYLTHWRY